MTDIESVRRVLWRASGGDLVPMLVIEYGDGSRRAAPTIDTEAAAFAGTVTPYELADELLLIDAERDRRIAAGVEYPVGSGRIIQTRPQDMENIGQQMLRALAVRSTPEAWGGNRSWLDASNLNPLPLPTPEDMLALALHVGNAKERLIYKSYEIKQQRRAGQPVAWTSDAVW
jgi:hypothetical protein